MTFGKRRLCLQISAVCRRAGNFRLWKSLSRFDSGSGCNTLRLRIKRNYEGFGFRVQGVGTVKNYTLGSKVLLARGTSSRACSAERSMVHIFNT